MNWSIKIANKAAKQVEKLPKSVKATLVLLLRDMEKNGPATSGWLEKLSEIQRDDRG